MKTNIRSSRPAAWASTQPAVRHGLGFGKLQPLLVYRNSPVPTSINTVNPDSFVRSENVADTLHASYFALFAILVKT
ncbi:MAG TPA: hypothetical protein DEB39_08675 [Planctomycetaceae bacterium]|nr:hypothetical protein [Planctomycetaceae bacterium]